MKPVAIFALTLMLAACKPADNEPGPGGVTVGEAAMLDEAAEMVEAKRLPPAAEEDGDTPDSAETAEDR